MSVKSNTNQCSFPITSLQKLLWKDEGRRKEDELCRHLSPNVKKATVIKVSRRGALRSQGPNLPYCLVDLPSFTSFFSSLKHFLWVARPNTATYNDCHRYYHCCDFVLNVNVVIFLSLSLLLPSLSLVWLYHYWKCILSYSPIVLTTQLVATWTISVFTSYMASTASYRLEFYSIRYLHGVSTLPPL